MSLAKIGSATGPTGSALASSERQRIVAMIRWAKADGWENVGIIGNPAGTGYWRNRRDGVVLDYWPVDGGIWLRVGRGGHGSASQRIGSALVTSVGQAGDVLAALRVVPARFSNQFVTGAMSVAERLVAAVTL